jgi:hypothetical protein
MLIHILDKDLNITNLVYLNLFVYLILSNIYIAPSFVRLIPSKFLKLKCKLNI